jgi:hypothetical protein
MTRYTYDTQTFRLLRQRSEKYIKTPSGNEPGKTDAIWSNENNLPVHTISPNGDIWQVFYPLGYVVPIYPKWIAYGKIINR